MDKLKITKDSQELLDMGFKVVREGVNYYHFPFWIQEKGGDFEVLDWDNMPPEAKRHITQGSVDIDKIYSYKKHLYYKLFELKIKTKEDVWVPVVVYECLYENPDGMIWARYQDDFYSLFEKVHKYEDEKPAKSE